MIRDIAGEIKKIKSTHRELRNFGLVVGGAFTALGIFLLVRGAGGYRYFLPLGAGLVVLGLIRPVLLRPLYRAWMALSVVLGWFMTRVILSVLFYLVITPIGVLARLSGKRFLGPETRQSGTGYWNYRNTEVPRKEDYLRQF